MRFPFFTKNESDSINQKIFRAALIIGLLTLVTRAGTIVKELAVARTFGRSDAMDAFLIAFLLPSFFVTLVMGAAGSALVPVFVVFAQHAYCDTRKALGIRANLRPACVLRVYGEVHKRAGLLSGPWFLCRLCCRYRCDCSAVGWTNDPVASKR